MDQKAKKMIQNRRDGKSISSLLSFDRIRSIIRANILDAYTSFGMRDPPSGSDESSKSPKQERKPFAFEFFSKEACAKMHHLFQKKKRKNNLYEKILTQVITL